MHRTRIKICGLTRPDDVEAACEAGADALGFVFYPGSPRYVSPEQAAALIARVPPYVSTVGLFVNASVEQLQDVIRIAPLTTLQFHGGESVEHSTALAKAAARAFVQVFRVKPDTLAANLLEYEQQYGAASNLFSGLLLDTFVDAYGGAGKGFDWSLIPKELAPRVVLSGGLSVQNATDAVLRVRPWAVDVSSGVEAAKGIKDRHQIAAFISAIRAADAIIEREKNHENHA
jgi:phosphoribosylanthranilate isomerase